MDAKPYHPLLDLTVSSQSSPKYLEEISVGQIQIQHATSGIRASDLQTQGTALDIRSQDLRRLEDSLDAVNKKQT
jgi:hypothetical protein